MPLDDKLISELDPTVDQMGAEVPVERGGENFKIDLARIVASVGPRPFPITSGGFIYLPIVEVEPSQGSNDVSLKFKLLIRQNASNSPTILEFIFGTNASTTGGGKFRLVSGFCPPQLFDNLRVDRMPISGGKFEFILIMPSGVYDSANAQVEIFDGMVPPSNLATWKTDGYSTGAPVTEESVYLTQESGGSGLPVDGSGGFDILSSEPSHAEGKLFYSGPEKTLIAMNDKTDVRLAIGRENWLRVFNSTGATIPNGTAVVVTGGTLEGTKVVATVALAKADLKANCQNSFVVTHDIPNNSYGEATKYGFVNGLDTSSFSNGDILYISPNIAGSYTTTEPTFPNLSAKVGRVARVDAVNGSIFADPDTDPQFATGGTAAFPPSITLSNINSSGISSTFGQLFRVGQVESTEIKPSYRDSQAAQFDVGDCDPVVLSGGRLRTISFSCANCAVAEGTKAATVSTRIGLYELKTSNEGGPSLIGEFDIELDPVSEIEVWNNVGPRNGIRGSLSVDVPLAAGTLLGAQLIPSSSFGGGNSFVNAWAVVVVGLSIY